MIELDLLVAAIGAATAIAVSVIGTLLTRQSSLKIRERQLKESQYIAYIDALSKLMQNNINSKAASTYASARNSILVIASPKAVKALIEYENSSIGKTCPNHDELLTDLLKAIRKDLKMSNKDYPTISFLKA